MRDGEQETYEVRPAIYSQRRNLASGDWEVDVLWPFIHSAHEGGTRWDDIRAEVLRVPTVKHSIDAMSLVVDDGGFIGRFDIRPWLWSVVRRYDAEHICQHTSVSAFFYLLTYSADSSSVYFAIHPFILRFLHEIESLEELRATENAIRNFSELPFAQGGEWEDLEDFMSSGDDEENDESEIDGETAINENQAGQPNGQLKGRLKKTELQILGGLMEYLRNSTRQCFFLRPYLFHSDKNFHDSTHVVTLLGGLARYSAVPWGRGVRKNYHILPLFFCQRGIGIEVISQVVRERHS